jgi:4-hydroxy-tetrahydrodipicolinate synthase
MFIESNPSPVKYAASLLGMCKPSVRLPLVEVKDETKQKVSEALKVAKLL